MLRRSINRRAFSACHNVLPNKAGFAIVHSHGPYCSSDSYKAFFSRTPVGNAKFFISQPSLYTGDQFTPFLVTLASLCLPGQGWTRNRAGVSGLSL